MMGSVKSTEEAVEALPADELAEFRRWCEQFDAAAWDAQLDADASAGKLDTLVAEALMEYDSRTDVTPCAPTSI